VPVTNLGDDVNDIEYEPCTLKNVICVSGINPDTNLTRAFAKGDSIFLYAPAVGTVAMQAPDQTLPPGSPPPPFSGTSAATPIVSASLAIALSINPLLTTGQARKLLSDSTCKTSHAMRMDGTACSPSKDPDVDKAGYLDLLELVRLARVSAGKTPLLACTGGWDAEEAGDNDTFTRALPLPDLSSVAHATTEFVPKKPDLSIHSIRKIPGSSDEDWYVVKFKQPLPGPGGTAQGFVAKFSLKVEDSSLATLLLEVQRGCAHSAFPQPLPPGDILSSQDSSGSGEASVEARLRSDVRYFIHVFGRIGFVNTSRGNCYSHVRVEVTDKTSLPGSCQ
jgi:hypothetical protein